LIYIDFVHTNYKNIKMSTYSGKQDKQSTAPRQGSSKIRVLILDDEKSFTEELHEFLEKSGYYCLEANTGQEGLDVLRNQEFDLLILDVLLPGMNGLDILYKKNSGLRKFQA